jgi:DMSO reductase iron-sulfur subunit
MNDLSKQEWPPLLFERTAPVSQHGALIDLARECPPAAAATLVLNRKPSFSANPNRYKQHGFHFNADNCIACHACESACSEKNNLPAHLAFRKVGFLEGGSWPDVRRINISMACNHCEDPVCLKGCPTRAYTKYAEYGAVLQDPDICFGCGYCTWVCPYNAPQLDPVKGQVEKCNMCVDRLEQGLKPACVAACLGNALEFGVIEDLPEGRNQAKLAIPGFPDPSISRPNIRFQQVKAPPNDFMRPDGVPIHYQRDEQGVYRVKPHQNGMPPEWGLARLSSRENPLVAFTLTSQFVVGAFLLLFLLPQTPLAAAAALTPSAHPTVYSACLFGLLGLEALSLLLSATHLGKPSRFYRGFNNLRHSWLSREALALSLFFAVLGAYTLAHTFPVLTAWLPPAAAARLTHLAGWAAAVLGPAAIYCMYRIYRIPARPFWDHWHSAGVFFASMLILGSAVLGVVFGPAELAAGRDIAALLRLLAVTLLAGAVLQAMAQLVHLRYLARRGAEAQVSRIQILTTYGKTYLARWASLGILFTAAAFIILWPPQGIWGMTAWGALCMLAVLHEVVGRALFYVLVTPTTMPGAFFWNNKYFEEHARRTGLAERPQVGVVAEAH